MLDATLLTDFFTALLGGGTGWIALLFNLILNLLGLGTVAG